MHSPRSPKMARIATQSAVVSDTADKLEDAIDALKGDPAFAHIVHRMSNMIDLLTDEGHRHLREEYSAAALDHASNVFRDIMTRAHGDMGIHVNESYVIDMPE